MCVCEIRNDDHCVFVKDNVIDDASHVQYNIMEMSTNTNLHWKLKWFHKDVLSMYILIMLQIHM